MTTESKTAGKHQLNPMVELGTPEKPIKKRKSLTRLFSSASRKSYITPTPVKEDFVPPTPQLPFELGRTPPQLSPQSSATKFHSVGGQQNDLTSPGVVKNLVGLGILEADVHGQPAQLKQGQGTSHSSTGHTRQRDFTGEKGSQKPRTASADNLKSKVVSSPERSSTFPFRKSASIRTSLRTVSDHDSLPQRKATSVMPSTNSRPAVPKLSIPSVSGKTPKSQKPVGKRSRLQKSWGQEGTVTTSPGLHNLPSSPQRPWQATHNNGEARSSFRSGVTTASSRTETTNATGGSVVTEDTACTDVTTNTYPRPESKADDGIMTVEEAIDLYAAGFADDVDEEPGESRDTSLSGEDRRRSIKIAEAISDNIGSPILHRPSTSRSFRSNTFNSRHRSEIFSVPSSSLPLTGSRDQYGFVKSNHYITRAQYDAWSANYVPVEERRNNKWTLYMRESGLSTDHPNRFPSRSAKTQRYIRKGIPPAWRGAAWFYYAGGDAYLSRHPQLYNNLIQLSDSKIQDNDKESIERDLHRTFPDNIRFKPDPDTPLSSKEETPLVSSLRRVLQAFALHSPRIGYCQSLNFIAALLLIFLPEEKAFWMLHIITKIYLPGTHETSLEGANVDLWVLMVALKNTFPDIWAKVGSAGAGNDTDSRSRLPPISLCTTNWFMSLFIGTLPVETVLRVWDVLFYEGSRTLFRVALVIFKLGEQRIKVVNDSMELFQVVQGLPRGMLDARSFMEVVNKKGGVSGDWIERRRGERRIWFGKERERKILNGEISVVEVTDEAQMQRPAVGGRKASVWRRRKVQELIG